MCLFLVSHCHTIKLREDSKKKKKKRQLFTIELLLTPHSPLLTWSTCNKCMYRMCNCCMATSGLCTRVESWVSLCSLEVARDCFLRSVDLWKRVKHTKWELWAPPQPSTLLWSLHCNALVCQTVRVLISTEMTWILCTKIKTFYEEVLDHQCFYFCLDNKSCFFYY